MAKKRSSQYIVVFLGFLIMLVYNCSWQRDFNMNLLKRRNADSLHFVKRIKEVSDSLIAAQKIIRTSDSLTLLLKMNDTSNPTTRIKILKTAKDSLKFIKRKIAQKRNLHKEKNLKEYIANYSSELDTDLGSTIENIFEAICALGIMVLLVLYCNYFLEIFSFINPFKQRHEYLNNLSLSVMSMYATFEITPYFSRYINLVLFKDYKPLSENKKFTGIYDNMISYYTTVSDVPFIYKLGSFVLFLITILGAIKGAYELREFYEKISRSGEVSNNKIHKKDGEI